MSAFNKNLLLLILSITGFLIAATGLASIVNYKPWGVPDWRRAEYDAKVRQLHERSRFEEETPLASRPRAIASQRNAELELQIPNSLGSHRFQVLNRGGAPLEISATGTESIQVVCQQKTLPGEDMTVELRWLNPSQGQGFEHSVTLTTNDPLTPSIELGVTGSTKRDLLSPELITYETTDPGVQTQAEFLLLSQNWQDFQIDDVASDSEIFQWHATPIDSDDPELAEQSATSGYRLRLITREFKYGKYNGNLRLSIRTSDNQTIEHELQYVGRIRVPIAFYSPDIHMYKGLDLGTVSSIQDHHYHLIVRVRGDSSRKIEVLRVEPPGLQASLEAQNQKGSYRLTLTIPEGMDTLVFNTQARSGYVEIGDPDDNRFKNWLPLTGAVVGPTP